MAYVLLYCAVSAWRTQFAEATCGTIRLKLLGLGACRVMSACGGSRSRWRVPAHGRTSLNWLHARLRNAVA